MFIKYYNIEDEHSIHPSLVTEYKFVAKNSRAFGFTKEFGYAYTNTISIIISSHDQHSLHATLNIIESSNLCIIRRSLGIHFNLGLQRIIKIIENISIMSVDTTLNLQQLKPTLEDSNPLTLRIYIHSFSLIYRQPIKYLVVLHRFEGK